MRVYQHSPEDKTFKVLLGEGEESTTDLLLGVRKTKGDPWLKVDNNIVNRIVLGLQPDPAYDYTLKYGTNLLDYQKRDVIRMVLSPYILNANPMGLGKTVEAVIAMRELNVSNALIIVPLCICTQWKNQIATWWPAMKDKVDINPSKVYPDRIAIFNYEKLLSEPLRTSMKAFRWDVLICDEAHRIKNHKSKRTIAIKSLPATRRWALTGTPILRRPDDLWSIFQFLSEEASGHSYWQFVEHFCHIQEDFWGKKIIGITEDSTQVAILNKLCNTVMIRNSSIEVAQRKQISVVTVPMDAKQKKLYKSTRDLIFEELPDTLTIPNGAVLGTRLQQITSWPGLWDSSEEAGWPGAKFEWIKETMGDNSTEKFVIFSRFAAAASALQHYLRRCGIDASCYTGKMDEQERFLAKEKFLHNKGTQAIIGTIGAMGQGIDELQSVCRTVIMLDRDWSPELMKQCEDRVHRMGQGYPVIVYYLECEHTFDRYVGKVNLSKTEDIRRALSDDV